MVPFFDVPSGRVVQIPASELRPGAVQARVPGIEGLVWLLPDQLQQGEVKHPPFEDGVRAYIRQIQEAFAEHRSLSFDEWEDGFRRDASPEREIAIWSHAADIYTAFAGRERSAERRRDIYRCIVACLTSGPDAVWHVLKPEVLSRAEAEQIVSRFFGQSAEHGAAAVLPQLPQAGHGHGRGRTVLQRHHALLDVAAAPARQGRTAPAGRAATFPHHPARQP
jgi:hypothetical protein